MRRLLIFIFILSRLTPIFGQAQSNETELIIIGTKHDGNRNFNHKKLYKTLAELNPDIILWEQSINFKRVFGLRTANFFNIWKPGIEQLALQKYSKRKPKIKILPFDTTITDRHNYIKNHTKFESVFFNSLSNAIKKYGDSLKYSSYITERNYYFGLVETKTLKEINNPEIFNLAREIYRKDEKIILPLARQYLVDTMMTESFENKSIFWTLRNNYMVRQIKNYLLKNNGKKIVVLTGLNHKYYLTENLINDSENNFKLIEMN